LRPDEPLDLHDVAASQHFTKPPPRYTEASLVKALESLGVGRPSPYATILSTLEERAYVVLGPPPAAPGEDVPKGRGARRVFVPTALGIAANDFLCRHFPTVVDPEFTARMEEGLDEVARGETAWRDLLARFYGPFSSALAAAGKADKVEVPEGSPSPQPYSRGRGSESAAKLLGTRGGGSSGRGARQPAVPTGEACPRCGKPLVRRVSKHGPFVGCSGYPRCDYTRDARREGSPSPQPSPKGRGSRTSTRSPRGKVAPSPSPSGGGAPGGREDETAPPPESAPSRRRGRGTSGLGASARGSRSPRSAPGSASVMGAEPGSAVPEPPTGGEAPLPLGESRDEGRSTAKREPESGSSSPGAAPACPRCGKPLVRRTQRSTGLAFLGCSGYPECRFTRSLPAR
jgi:ssDNA-binding Zn-finger/Zn-ribbon topoisomerase 1